MFILETMMRNALFFLSLTVLALLYGVLGMHYGIIIAIPLFLISFWGILLRKKITIFHLIAMTEIGVLLTKGVHGTPLSRAFQIGLCILTILLILAYSGESKEVDIAPTFAIFVALMFFLQTFLHLPIPEKFLWSSLVFLTSASMVDDWNARRRLPELEEHAPQHSECS